ncbi:hypothetical protein [Bacillus mycoides]|uniref:hypothetical protein n=1 Tax=Bacillus mycoides TaxID=1405 RepID=UPI003D6594E3
MEKYEFIHVSIHKKSKEETVWRVDDGVNTKYVEVDAGKNYFDIARLKILNKLGEEGWHLGTSRYLYEFLMQRKIMSKQSDFK